MSCNHEFRPDGIRRHKCIKCGERQMCDWKLHEQELHFHDEKEKPEVRIDRHLRCQHCKQKHYFEN